MNIAVGEIGDGGCGGVMVGIIGVVGTQPVVGVHKWVRRQEHPHVVVTEAHYLCRVNPPVPQPLAWIALVLVVEGVELYGKALPDTAISAGGIRCDPVAISITRSRASHWHCRVGCPSGPSHPYLKHIIPIMPSYGALHCDAVRHPHRGPHPTAGQLHSEERGSVIVGVGISLEHKRVCSHSVLISRAVHSNCIHILKHTGLETVLRGGDLIHRLCAWQGGVVGKSACARLISDYGVGGHYKVVQTKAVCPQSTLCNPCASSVTV
mmetsp:Transcript_9330/g.15343  ORF Transcript_9330/g.15343 Transcript_9330/m.15343 type:complete len:265 (-) Transcript_9330:62-856(-)